MVFSRCVVYEVLHYGFDREAYAGASESTMLDSNGIKYFEQELMDIEVEMQRVRLRNASTKPHRTVTQNSASDVLVEYKKKR